VKLFGGWSEQAVRANEQVRTAAQSLRMGVTVPPVPLGPAALHLLDMRTSPYDLADLGDRALT
jgi:hypothetical protein